MRGVDLWQSPTAAPTKSPTVPPTASPTQVGKTHYRDRCLSGRPQADHRVHVITLRLSLRIP
jgi:hypothetical protein